MRALCGAIITAGALIGLGLAAIGIGTRYQTYPYHNAETGKAQWVHLRELDAALLVALVVLIAAACIGVGIAFVGLAYHHRHRHHEFLKLHGTPMPPPPGEHRLPA
ncbi:MAG TPA: hypothetical protein VKS79_26150 [Gemmataceae bacterium]|nr:hypothetical protein [Gemmataceae bacterium]